MRGVGGEGLEGVAVTNGEHVTRTKEDGSYRLTVQEGIHRFVHIAVPSGLRARSGWYRQVSGAAGSDMDFDLEPGPEALGPRFRAAHITDTHVSVQGGRSWTSEVLTRDLRTLERSGSVDVVFATGDLTARGRAPELQSYAVSLGSIGIPVLSVFGGHDGNDERYNEGCELSYTRNYEGVLGPTYHSFNIGRWHFIAYASEDYFFSPQEARMKATWLEADLHSQPQDKPITILMHTPPSASFLDAVSHHNLGLVLCGHWHSSKVYEYRGITVAATQPLPYGGIDTTPRGYRLTTFDDETFRSELVALSEQGPEGRGPQDTRVVWTKSLSTSSRASAVALANTIILSVSDEAAGHDGGVACLDAGTGDLVWRTRTDSSVRNGVVLGLRGDEEVCAAVSVTGRIYLLAAESGDVIWETDLPGHPDRWVFTRPVVDDATVWAGAKAGYGAFSIEDGSPMWYGATGPNDAWPCYASPSLHEDLLIVLISRRGLLALDKKDGGTAWETELPVEYHFGSHVITGDKVVTGADSGKLAILKAQTGEVISEDIEISGRYPTGLSVDQGAIFTSTSDGFVQSHDLASAEVLWTFQSGQDILDMTPYARNARSVLATPLAVEGSILACGCDGCIHVLERETGVERSRVFLGAPIPSSPCVTRRGIFVVTQGQGLFSLPESVLRREGRPEVAGD